MTSLSISAKSIPATLHHWFRHTRLPVTHPEFDTLLGRRYSPQRNRLHAARDFGTAKESTAAAVTLCDTVAPGPEFGSDCSPSAALGTFTTALLRSLGAWSA